MLPKPVHRGGSVSLALSLTDSLAPVTSDPSAVASLSHSTLLDEDSSKDLEPEKGKVLNDSELDREGEDTEDPQSSELIELLHLEQNDSLISGVSHSTPVTQSVARFSSPSATECSSTSQLQGLTNGEHTCEQTTSSTLSSHEQTRKAEQNDEVTLELKSSICSTGSASLPEGQAEGVVSFSCLSVKMEEKTEECESLDQIEDLTEETEMILEPIGLGRSESMRKTARKDLKKLLGNGQGRYKPSRQFSMDEIDLKDKYINFHKLHLLADLYRDVSRSSLHLSLFYIFYCS